MHALIPDLKKLTRFYSGLEKDLTAILSHSEKDSELSLSESILTNRTRLAQVERMNAHILQLSEDLKRSRNSLDAETRQETDALAIEAKSSAIRIRTLCARATEELETTKNDLLKELEEISKGMQYLKSSNPVKTNYPKFIDSTG